MATNFAILVIFAIFADLGYFWQLKSSVSFLYFRQFGTTNDSANSFWPAIFWTVFHHFEPQMIRGDSFWPPLWWTFLRHFWTTNKDYRTTPWRADDSGMDAQRPPSNCQFFLKNIEIDIISKRNDHSASAGLIILRFCILIDSERLIFVSRLTWAHGFRPKNRTRNFFIPQRYMRFRRCFSSFRLKYSRRRSKPIEIDAKTLIKDVFDIHVAHS